MLNRFFRIALVLPLLSPTAALAQQGASASSPLAQRIAHTDPTKYHHMPSVHNGAGPMDYMPLYDTRPVTAFERRRCELPPLPDF
jgi:hypothetical protein